MNANQTLQEYADNSGNRLAVDRARGVIPGVKLLGRVSRKGREYPPAVMAKALPLYEGMRVNVDHIDPGQRRSLRDRIGLVKNVTLRDDGLYGDFHFNPKHPLAEQIAWDAENAPQNLGFSHDTRGGTRNVGGKIVVESIDKVLSVDLVANPATTIGLFEDTATDTPLQEAWTPHQREMALASRRAHAKTAYAASMQGPPSAMNSKAHRAAAAAERDAADCHRTAEKAQRRAGGNTKTADEHAELAKAHDKGAAEHEQAAEEMAADEKEGAQEDITMTEHEELVALRAEKATRELQESIATELKAAGLDPANKTAVSDVFMEDLTATTDQAKRAAKIADRKAVLAPSQPAGNAPRSSMPLIEDSAIAPPPATAPLAERLRRFAT